MSAKENLSDGLSFYADLQSEADKVLAALENAVNSRSFQRGHQPNQKFQVFQSSPTSYQPPAVNFQQQAYPSSLDNQFSQMNIQSEQQMLMNYMQGNQPQHSQQINQNSNPYATQNIKPLPSVPNPYAKPFSPTDGPPLPPK
eukprot:NODE_76_length_23837_cov_1.242396.p16 type:complete len:142 gc:universal NODE_76_length_23837_cov_1.242396:21181-21606(+)